MGPTASPKHPWMTISTNAELLIQAVHRRSYGHVVISHIIPRLVDFETSDAQVTKYNDAVHKYCKKLGISTIPTYNTFMSYAKLHKTEDELHPSPEGDIALRTFLASHIAKIRDEFNYKRTKRRPRDTIIVGAEPVPNTELTDSCLMASSNLIIYQLPI